MFDKVDLHAYRSSAGWTIYNGLRWRYIDLPAGRPIRVGESGWDQVRDGPNGTLLPPDCSNCGPYAQGQTTESIDAGFKEYNIELVKDNVKAVAFCTSPTDDWDAKGFNLNELAKIAEYSNIGPYDIAGNNPAAMDWAARASIVKSQGNPAAISKARPDAETYFRWPFNQQQQTVFLAATDKKWAAGIMCNQIIAGLAGFRHPLLHVQLLNEVPKGLTAPYVELSKWAIDILHGQGLLVCGPSWSTGDYEKEQWLAFFPQGVKVPIDYGPRAKTLGAFIHATRSGKDKTPEQEFDDSVQYLSTTTEASANVVIGHTREKIIVPKTNGSAHARDPVNRTHVGYELVQSKPNVPYVLYQYKRLAFHLVEDARVFNFPLVRVMSQKIPGYIGHEDSENGKQDKKNDPGNLFDYSILAAEIKKLTVGVFDIKKERDAIWAIANNCEAHGHPWFATGLKASTALSKKEQ